MQRIWDFHLDECSLKSIAEMEDLPVGAVKKVLADPVPERFASDERTLPYLFFWISVQNHDAPMEIIRMDKSVNRDGRSKTLRHLRRMFTADHAGAVVDLTSPYRETIEAKVACAMVLRQGIPCYVISGDLTVRVATADDFPAFAIENLKLGPPAVRVDGPNKGDSGEGDLRNDSGSHFGL